LLAVLAEAGDWNVRKITQALRAPFSTVSSALDRLEARKLVGRRRRPGDRRVVYIELTRDGFGWQRNYALPRSKPAARCLRDFPHEIATNLFALLLKSRRGEAQSLNSGSPR